jgi:hypothetical protein
MPATAAASPTSLHVTAADLHRRRSAPTSKPFTARTAGPADAGSLRDRSGRDIAYSEVNPDYTRRRDASHICPVLDSRSAGLAARRPVSAASLSATGLSFGGRARHGRLWRKRSGDDLLPATLIEGRLWLSAGIGMPRYDSLCLTDGPRATTNEPPGVALLRSDVARLWPRGYAGRSACFRVRCFPQGRPCRLWRWVPSCRARGRIRVRP